MKKQSSSESIPAFLLQAAKNASVVDSKRVETAKQKTARGHSESKERRRQCKKKVGGGRGAQIDRMDQKEKIKAPSVSLWPRYHFSL